MKKEEIICRLCLKVSDGEFEVIEEITREIFEVLQLKLNLSISRETVMCKTCSENLQKCFNFKEICMNTEDCIAPFVSDTNDSKVDIKEVFLAENKDTNIVDHNICRFCLQIIEGRYESLETLNKEMVLVKEMLPKCMPEMNLKSTKDPVICMPCVESLKNFLLFLKNCWDIEEQLDEYCNAEGTNSKGQIILNELLHFNSTLSIIKEENLSDVEEYKNFGEHMVKLEEEDINVKDEENLTHAEERSPNGFKYTIPSPKPKSSTGKPVCKKIYKCETCRYETKYESSFRKHQIAHQNSSVYKCDFCSFTSNVKSNIKNHMPIHMDMAMYKCEVCMYKSKHKQCLKRHMLVHKNPSDITMYKCDKCSHETKHEHNLKTHMLTHKDPSATEMYKCKDCTYETKKKSLLKLHIVIHKDPMELKMYKCELCTFWSKRRAGLKRHLGTHRNVSV